MQVVGNFVQQLSVINKILQDMFIFGTYYLHRLRPVTKLNRNNLIWIKFYQKQEQTKTTTVLEQTQTHSHMH